MVCTFPILTGHLPTHTRGLAVHLKITQQQHSRVTFPLLYAAHSCSQNPPGPRTCSALSQKNQHTLCTKAAENLGGRFLYINGALIGLNDLLMAGLQSTAAEIQYIINHVTIFCCLHTHRGCAHTQAGSSLFKFP